MKRILATVLLALVSFSAWADGLIGSVEYDSNSNVLRFPLFDQDTPDTCPSTDISSSTSGLIINVSNDVQDGFYDQYQQSDSTLEAITTIGTYAAPTATKARFEVIAAGSCWYELHLPDAAFSDTGGSGGTVEASRLYIEVSDGGAEIMDATYWVDLTPVSLDSLLSASCAAYASDNTVGYQLCTALDAILTDTGTTLDNKLTDIQNAQDFQTLWSGTVDTGGVTSQTVLISVSGPAADDYSVGRSMCVEDASATDTEIDCALITDYVASTQTWTLANALDFFVADGDRMFIAPQDVNVKAMNSSEVCGNGQTGTPWTGNGC